MYPVRMLRLDESSRAVPVGTIFPRAADPTLLPLTQTGYVMRRFVYAALLGVVAVAGWSEPARAG